MASKKAPVKKAEKQYYKVVVDVLVPAQMTYRILAEDETEALKLADMPSAVPISVQYQINHRKKIKLIIYNFGTTIIKMVKNF